MLWKLPRSHITRLRWVHGRILGFYLERLRTGSSDEVYITGLDRNLGVEAAELAQARGLLRYIDSDEGVAWVITDSTRANATGRLLHQNRESTRLRLFGQRTATLRGRGV